MRNGVAILASVTTLIAVAAGSRWGGEPDRGHAATSLGPFLVSIPVPGLEATDRDAVVKALHAAVGEHDVHEPKCEAGRLEFYFGGSGPDAILRLRPLVAALGKAGFEIDPRLWTFEAQTIGLRLATRTAVGEARIREVLKASGKAEVLGWILDGEALGLVIELESGTETKELEAAFAAAGVAVADYAWGHWHHGYGIPESAHGHRHEVRMNPGR